MKAVGRLPGEPPGLAAYRLTNPRDDAAPGSQANEVWERFRADHAYQELREALIAAQKGLCAYCEQRVTKATGELVPFDYQIEHVLAKFGGSNRTLDWANVLLCCGGGTYRHHPDEARRGTGRANESCGQRKGEAELGPGCDPRTFPLVPRLVEVGLDGTISACAEACTKAGIDPMELDRTLNHTLLNLNCDRLKRARRKVAENLREWVIVVARDLLTSSHLSVSQHQSWLTLLVAGRL